MKLKLRRKTTRYFWEGPGWLPVKIDKDARGYVWYEPNWCDWQGKEVLVDHMVYINSNYPSRRFKEYTLDDLRKKFDEKLKP